MFGLLGFFFALYSFFFWFAQEASICRMMTFYMLSVGGDSIFRVSAEKRWYYIELKPRWALAHQQEWQRKLVMLTGFETSHLQINSFSDIKFSKTPGNFLLWFQPQPKPDMAM